MIRKLKIRMILLVLVGLLLASAGLVAAINGMNWNSLSQQANAVLDMLAENGGQRPNFVFRNGINSFRVNDRKLDTPPPDPDGTPRPDDSSRPPWIQDGQNDTGRDRMRSTPAIMNAASQSSRIPCFAKEAAIGMVPYIQSGEAIPSRQDGIIPSRPHFLSRIPRKRLWIPSLANTETKEPMAMPSSQYQKICVNWSSK